MLQNETRPEPSPRERLERLRVLLKRTRGYWKGAVALAIAVSSVGIAVAWRLPRVYMSETLVLARDAIRTGPEDDAQGVHVSRIAPKLKDLLTGRSRLESIIAELKLYPGIVEKRGILDAVEEMRLHVGFRARDSDTFLISFQSDDPDVAQKVTARLADSMIEDFVNDSVSRAMTTRDFLMEEERHAERDLDQKGRELAVFVAHYPQFAWDPTKTQGPLGVEIPKNSMTSQAPITNDPELASLYRERARIEGLLSGAARAKAPEPTAGAAANEGAAPLPGSLAALKVARVKAGQELAAAQADLAEKRTRYTEEHPDLVAARNRVVASGRALNDAERALLGGESAQQTAGGAPAAVETAEIEHKLAQIRGAIAVRERAVATTAPLPSVDGGSPPTREGGFVALEAEWQRLMREAADARRHKEDITGKRAKAELSASAAKSSGTMVMTVIDPAFRPERPIKPNRRLAAGLSAGLGALLGMLWALSGVLLSDIVHDPTDLDAAGAPPVLAVIPREKKRRLPSTELVLRGASHGAERAHAPPWRREAPDHDEEEWVESRPRPIVTEPAWAGPRAMPRLPPGAISTSTERVHAAPAVAVGARVEAYPIHDLGAGIVVSASPSGGPAPRSAPVTFQRETRIWGSRARNGWGGRVQRESWGSVLDGAMADGVLGGAVEPCDVVLDAGPDGGLDAASFLSPPALSALRLLRHWVEQRAGQGGSVVGITSAGRGEGKTRLAAQLALALAESDRARVLLVEANFERPSLAGFFGLTVPPACGFSSQIRRRMLHGSKESWGVVSVGPALHLLLEATGSTRWPAALHSREFALAVGELRGRYDYVVIDGPSVMDGGNATSIEMVADGLLMVARAGVSRASAIKRAGRTLGGRRLLGVVLSDVAERPS